MEEVGIAETRTLAPVMDNFSPDLPSWLAFRTKGLRNFIHVWHKQARERRGQVKHVEMMQRKICYVDVGNTRVSLRSVFPTVILP